MSWTGAPAYDYVIAGGGTAGAVVAARLSEDPRVTVGLLEWGPDDSREPRALQLRRWSEMLEGEYDLDYASVQQPRGNSHIRQARARILGGCSSHNTMIALLPPAADFDRWAALGARGWDAAAMSGYFARLAVSIVPVAPEHRNPYLADVIEAASAALGIPVREDWNATGYRDGAGFVPLGYYPQTGVRSSSSVAYLHPVMGRRDNLDVLTRTRVLRVTFGEGRRATGVTVRREDGQLADIAARREVIVCCGAIDTPRLLMLSGVGPADELRRLGIDVVADSPGVGGNLCDHPEGLIVWEATRPLPPQGASDWDMTIMYRTDPASAVPDVLAHVPLMTFAMHSERLGYPTPRWSITMTPNVTRPRSRGRVTLASADPADPPLIDYRWFTDADGRRRADAAGGHADGAPRRGAGPDGRLGGAGGLPRPRGAGGRGAVGAGPRDLPHRVPRLVHRPDGRAGGPGRGARPAAAGPRGGPAAGHRRLRVPGADHRQPDGRRADAGRAGRRAGPRLTGYRVTSTGHCA